MKDRVIKGIVLVLVGVLLMGLVACAPKSGAASESTKEEAAKAEVAAAETTAETTADVTTVTSPIETTKPGEGNRIYFAAPLFNDGERDYNLKIVTILESYGYEVFLPQRDGFLAPDLEGLTEEEKITKIFNKDMEEVYKADIFFMVMDGRVPDEGACVELGMAYVAGKRCYSFKNDARVLESDLAMNPMLEGCFIEMFYDLNGEALIQSLEDYLKENQL